MNVAQSLKTIPFFDVLQLVSKPPTWPTCPNFVMQLCTTPRRHDSNITSSRNDIFDCKGQELSALKAG